MSKHFTRLFNPHADTGPGRDGAPLLPDETIQPREAPGAMPSMRVPSGTTREQLREQLGESLAEIGWAAEQQLRNELAAKVQDLQGRLAEVNRQIAEKQTFAEPQMKKLERLVDHHRQQYLDASTDLDNARIAKESQIMPLRNQVESLLRELHQPLHASRTKNWQSVPDSTSVLPREH